MAGAIRRFLVSDDGLTAVDYAIILAICIVAYQCRHLLSETTMQRASFYLRSMAG